MRYVISTLVILLSLFMISPSTADLGSEPTKSEKTIQPKIFSDKLKPTKCIDKIQVQQRTMVTELKKIKNLLKKKKN